MITSIIISVFRSQHFQNDSPGTCYLIFFFLNYAFIQILIFEGKLAGIVRDKSFKCVI